MGSDGDRLHSIIRDAEWSLKPVARKWSATNLCYSWILLHEGNESYGTTQTMNKQNILLLGEKADVEMSHTYTQTDSLHECNEQHTGGNVCNEWTLK